MMKKLGLALLFLIAFVGSSFAQTSVQWGANKGSSPWTVCIYDSVNTCQPFFKLPATGGGALLPPSTGGTGINNGSSTITIGGPFALSGAYSFTGTLTGNTNLTFPPSGTLATTGAGLDIAAEPRTVTGLNTLQSLSHPVAGALFFLSVNGLVATPSVSGTTVTWNPSTQGYDLETTDSVVAFYSY